MHQLHVLKRSWKLWKRYKGYDPSTSIYKVEMVSIVEKDKCLSELERMTNCATGILDDLNLPYRKLILCSGDMGFSAEKTYDIEVWLPSENRYREIIMFILLDISSHKNENQA